MYSAVGGLQRECGSLAENHGTARLGHARRDNVLRRLHCDDGRRILPVAKFRAQSEPCVKNAENQHESDEPYRTRSFHRISS